MTSPERQEVAARIAAAGGDGALALQNAVRELAQLRAQIAEAREEFRGSTPDSVLCPCVNCGYWGDECRVPKTRALLGVP